MEIDLRVEFFHGEISDPNVRELPNGMQSAPARLVSEQDGYATLEVLPDTDRFIIKNVPHTSLVGDNFACWDYI